MTRAPYIVGQAIRQCREYGVQPVRVRCFAAPYGVENTYSETFEPRVMRGKLHAPLPMFLQHDPEHFPVAGAWLDIGEDDKGVWAEGVVLHPLVAENLDRAMHDFPEVSVAWIGGGRQYSRPARERQGFKPLLVTADIAEGLAEISLVDSGAFPGTGWWRV